MTKDDTTIVLKKCRLCGLIQERYRKSTRCLNSVNSRKGKIVCGAMLDEIGPVTEERAEELQYAEPDCRWR